MSVALRLEHREDFERWLYCRACGRRLRYHQWEDTDRSTGRPFAQWMSKRCPLARVDDGTPEHDWVEFQQRFSSATMVRRIVISNVADDEQTISSQWQRVTERVTPPHTE